MNKYKAIKTEVTALDVFVPIRTVSEANQREHWAEKHKRKKDQQLEVTVALQNALRGRRVRMPCTVTLTRIGPKALDSDNLAGAMKHCQDSVARKLGIDDGDVEKVKWIYEQRPIGQHYYGVKIQIAAT